MWLNIYLASALPSSSRWFTSPWGTVRYHAINQLKPTIVDSSSKSMKRYRGDKMESTCSNGQEPHNIATIVYYYSPFLKKIWGGHMSFRGATDTPVLDFWWHLLWVSEPEQFFRSPGPFWSQLITLVFYLSDLTLRYQSQCTFGSYLVLHLPNLPRLFVLVRSICSLDKGSTSRPIPRGAIN